MRGTIAKRLRAQIYGNKSKRNEGRYRMIRGVLTCAGLRGLYKKLKKERKDV
jgi:hypothetical protein